MGVSLLILIVGRDELECPGGVRAQKFSDALYVVRHRYLRHEQQHNIASHEELGR
jgi:hypothetical protein